MDKDDAFSFRSLFFGILIVLGLVLALPVLVVGTWLAWGTWQNQAFKRNTPIAANLIGQSDSMRERFRGRLREKFPPGMPIDQVMASLRSQGFAPSDTSKLPSQPERDAEADKVYALPATAQVSVPDPSALCTFRWIVGWEVDAERRLKAIYGDLRGYCL